MIRTRWLIFEPSKICQRPVHSMKKRGEQQLKSGLLTWRLRLKFFDLDIVHIKAVCTLAWDDIALVMFAYSNTYDSCC